MAKLFENPRSIAIEGPIRAGKSTLATLLAQEIGAARIVEPQQNPFLPQFYRGERSAAFPAQMWFLMSRYEQLCAAAERDTKAGKLVPVVADYIFEKDKLFACLNLSDDELALYERQYQYFRDQLPTPDLVIYLQASPKVLRTRLERKGLPDERTISGRYLEQVVQAYEHFFFHYTASDLLVVNTDDIDFVHNNQDLQTLLRRLKEPVHGTQYFLPLGGGDQGSARSRLRAMRAQTPSLRSLISTPRVPTPTLRSLTWSFAPGIVQAAQRLCRAL
ncbi:MAG TPA: deoxynucleoside kinase [Acidobacteriaceae bacterium]|nr:deoxynucleoside kinase [Acidobacteriaceae bacterium]